ncbi:MAG: two-component regulator propeller domain-containing protein [Terriglobales bacterium]
MNCGPNPSRWLSIGLALACFLGEAGALPAKYVSSRYVRQQWSSETSLAGGPVRAITQTPDGYLWIGASKSVVRFDGFSFHPVPSSNPQFRNDPILGLTVDSSGSLCVLFWGAGVLCDSGGKGENLVLHNGASPVQITAASREKDGTMLLADALLGVLRIQKGAVEILASAPVLPGSSLIVATAKTGDGKIWLGTLAEGLFSLADGRAIHITAGIQSKRINCLLAVGEKELWVGTDKGVFRGDGASFHRVALPSSAAGAQVLTMLQDHNGNVWLGTTVGLLKIDPDGVLSSDLRDFGNGSVNALFEDREGNLWVGGAHGVERIRESTFVTYSVEDGLAQQSGPVYADPENRIWFAPAQGGINLIKEGYLQRAEAILKRTGIYSITGSKDEIWVGTQHNGLMRLRYSDGIRDVRTYTKADGLAENSVYSVYRARDGAVWAGTLTGGVSRFKDGKFVTYTTADGLASNTISSILETRDGAIWFATPNGLTSLSENKWKTYAVRDGLPSYDVNCLLEDSSGVLWVGTSAGLAFLSSGQVHVPRNTTGYFHEETLGIAQDKQGWLWIATSNRVLRVRADSLSRDALSAGDVREYGPADGLGDARVVKRDRSVVAGSDGRIWFSMNRGVSAADPSHISASSAPALVHVEAVSADGKTIEMLNAVRIPPRSQRIGLTYTGLSLANPERVRFRYTLEGFEHDWSEPVDARAAVYTNLGPGSYRFRIVASNSDGQWNGPETLFPFEVEPAYWQTMWFRMLCMVAIVSMVLLAYQLRLRQLTHQLNVRFEERLAERMRIAQELHDTLLQGVLSASMQLNVANDQLSSESPAKPLVRRVLELMGQVIEEGRRALQGLRVSRVGIVELERAFSRVPEELALEGPVDFRVIVEGQTRRLHPIIHDEVYLIGREAVANAFRHAYAKKIDLSLEYHGNELRIVVRDDGRGIDPKVIQLGRDGHWGLSGMRERAERIGASLKVSSSAAGGTEVDLRVPGRIAFEPSTSTRTPKSIVV